MKERPQTAFCNEGALRRVYQCREKTLAPLHLPVHEVVQVQSPENEPHAFGCSGGSGAGSTALPCLYPRSESVNCCLRVGLLQS